MGDPSGIGPEIIIKSFENSEIRNNRIIVIGDYNVMQAAGKMLRIESFKLNRIHNVQDSIFKPGVLNILDLPLVNMNDLQPGKVRAVSGNAAFECIRKAVVLARNKDIDANMILSKCSQLLPKYKMPAEIKIVKMLPKNANGKINKNKCAEMVRDYC